MPSYPVVPSYPLVPSYSVEYTAKPGIKPASPCLAIRWCLAIQRMPSYSVEYTAKPGIKAASPWLAIQWSTQQSSHQSRLSMASYPVEYTAKQSSKLHLHSQLPAPRTTLHSVPGKGPSTVSYPESWLVRHSHAQHSSPNKCFWLA